MRNILAPLVGRTFSGVFTTSRFRALHRVWPVALVLGVFAASPRSFAATVQKTVDIGFTAVNQNMFSPFLPVISLDKTFGNISSPIPFTDNKLGVTGKVVADSGTINAAFNGGITATYDNALVAPGLAKISLDFFGASSAFSSKFGAKTTADATFTLDPPGAMNAVSGAIQIAEFGPLVLLSNTFVAGLGTPLKLEGSDDALGVGRKIQGSATSNGIVLDYKAQADANLTARQATTFDARNITGDLEYTNIDTGTRRFMSFMLDSSGRVDLAS